MKLLRQTTSGEIFVWNKNIADRLDMEEYFRPPVNVLPPEVINHAEEAIVTDETQVISVADPVNKDIAFMAQAVLGRKGKK